MYKVLLTFLLCISLSFGQEFRGGSIAWSVPANSTTVTYTFYAYWTPGQEDTSLFVNWGDGKTDFVDLSAPTISLPSFSLTTATATHTFPLQTSYTTVVAGCCRLQTKNVPADTGYELTTRVDIDGTYQVSPILITGAPILSIGVGSNAVPLSSSLPGFFDFAPYAMSSIDMYATAYGGSAPVVTPDALFPTLATLNWATRDSDTGLWSFQVSFETITPKKFLVVSDFIVQVESTASSVVPPSLSVNPAQQFYSVTSGSDVQFALTCSGPAAGSKVGIFVSGFQPGMAFNGAETSGTNATAGTPVTFKWTNPQTVNGLTTPYSLSFVCFDYATNLLSAPLKMGISVGIPLTLVAPPPVYLQCWQNCKCIDTSAPTYTSGCCNSPAISFEDYPQGSGNCNNVIIRVWKASNQCGQTATANQTIYVNDTTAPMLSDPKPEIPRVFCYSELSLTSDVVVTDNCDRNLRASMIATSTNGTSNCNNVVTRTFSAQDNCGNKNSTKQVILVNNDVPPSIVPVKNTYTTECNNNLAKFDGLFSATDYCGGKLPLVVTDSVSPIPSCGSWNRTWTATSSCGITSSVTHSLTVKHTVIPTISMPDPPATVQCVSDCFFRKPTATSYCGIPLGLHMLSDVNDTSACKKFRTITWVTDADECGLTATGTQTISVENTVPPTIHVPADFKAECSLTRSIAEITDPKYAGKPYAFDACGIPLTDFSFSDSAPTSGCNSTIKRTWTVKDFCGLTSSGVQTIYIEDTHAPEFFVTDFYGQCPTDVSNVTTPSFTDCHASSVTVTFTDSITKDPAQNPNCGDRNISRTWTLNDGCGNSANHVQNIYIKDTTPPVIFDICDATVECPSKATPDRTGTPCVKDNCYLSGTPTYSDTQMNLTWIVRTWTIVDNCGNSASSTQNIYLILSSPTLVIPPNVTVACMAATGPNFLGYATANDNCIGTLSPTYEDTISGTCPTIITRRWSVFDPITNETYVGVQIITVDHNGAGTINGISDRRGFQCVSDTLQNVDSPSYTKICAEDVITGPNYTDSISPQESCANAPGGYIVTRTWKIEDQCGRTSSASQKLYVKDTVPPTFTCFPNDRNLNCSTYMGNDTPRAHDNCDGDNVTVTHVDVPDSQNCPTKILRIFTAKDCAGNAANYTQVFTISRSPPTFNGVPSNDKIECPYIDNYLGANVTATDSCKNIIRAVPTVSQSGICPTTFVITWTATDACGISNSVTQTIVANDTTAPTLVLTEDAATIGTCPNSIPTEYQVKASDNCFAGKPKFTQVSGNLHENCTCVECLQEVVREWIVFDLCGNPSSVVEQRILTQKNTKPVITVPPNFDNCRRCDDDVTPNPVTFGYATAVDQCGNVLPTLYSDSVSVSADGQYTHITRTWSATDTCGQTSNATQLICLANPQISHYYSDDDDFIPNKENYCVWRSSKRHVGCGKGIDDLPKPRCKNVCGDLTYNFTFPFNCSDDTGSFVRKCDVHLRDKHGNNRKLYSGDEIFIMDKCPFDKVRANGVVNIPSSPQALGTDFTPAVFIRNKNLPCDVVTFVFFWGDNEKTTIVCDPSSPSPNCVFDFQGKTLSASYPHRFKTTGSFTIRVLVYSRGISPPNPLPTGVTQGNGWSVYTVTVVVFDPTKGRVTGNVVLGNYAARSIGTTSVYVLATFGTSFSLNNETVLSPNGNTQLVSKNPALGELFASVESPRFLELFAPTKFGYAALWRGIGKWKFLDHLVDYEAFALDTSARVGYQSNKDIFHIKISDPQNGNHVIFDSNPDAKLDAIDQRVVVDGAVTVSNPPPKDTVAGVTEEDFQKQKSALIGVAVLAAIFGVALLIAIAAIVYLKHELKGGHETKTVKVPKLGK